MRVKLENEGCVGVTSKLQAVARNGSAGRRTQRATLNAVSALLDYSARLAVNFVVTPILVRGLGSAQFGFWQILGRLVAYVSVADGRPTQALKWVVANHQESADDHSKRRLVGSALFVWLRFLPLLLLAGAILVVLAPLILKAPPEFHTIARVACGVMVLNLVLQGLVGLPEATLRGMNLGYKRMGVVAGLNVLGGALMTTAVHLGWGLIGVAAAQLLLSICTGLLFWYLVRRYLPWFGVERPSSQEIRRFTGLGFWYLAWALVNKLLIASDVVVLGMLLSSETVTSYVLTGYLSNSVVGIISLVVGAAIPGIGGLVGRKEFARVLSVRQELRALTTLVLSVVGGTILLWNSTLIGFWVGQDKYAGGWVNLLLMLATAQLVFIRNDAFIIDVTLELPRKVLLGAAAVILSVGFSAFLVPRLGVAGVPLGFIVGRSVLTLTYPRLVAGYFGKEEHQRTGFPRPLIVMASIFACSAYLGERIDVESKVLAAVLAAGTFVVLAGIAATAALTPEQRRSLRARVRIITDRIPAS